MAGPRTRSFWNLLARAGLVVGGVLLLLVAWLYAKMPRPGSRRVEAAVQVVGVNDGVSFAWILRTAHGAALIDAGFEPTGEAIVEELHRQGLAPEDVHTVLFTHGHPDHFGGATAFPRAKLYAGPGEAALIHGERTPRSPAARFVKLLGPPPPRPGAITELRDGEELELDGEHVRVHHVPGHTPGSVVYLWREVLFTGDALLRDGEGVMLAPRFFSEDVPRARESLRPLVKAPFTQMADGHTGVTADARQKLEKLLR